MVTVQVPCEVTPGSVPVTVKAGLGTSSTTTTVMTVSPGIFESTMSDGNKRAAAVRDDGSFADIGSFITNPARRGETVRIYVTGLGPTLPAVGTNSIQNPNADLFGKDALVAGTVAVNIGGSINATVISARQAPTLIGVYEVQFVVPSGATAGNDVALTVSIVPQGGSTAQYSATSKIPIQ